MKITKRQLRRIIREEKRRILKENAVNVYLDRNPDPYGSSSFNFEDEGGGMRVTGKMLSPQDLRQLADAIEQVMSPDYQPRGPIRLDID